MHDGRLSYFIIRYTPLKAADILSQTGSFDKKATANIVSGANTNITNSVNEQNVDIKKEEIKTSGEKITYSFAPRSFTQIIVKVK